MDKLKNFAEEIFRSFGFKDVCLKNGTSCLNLGNLYCRVSHLPSFSEYSSIHQKPDGKITGVNKQTNEEEELLYLGENEGILIIETADSLEAAENNLFEDSAVLDAEDRSVLSEKLKNEIEKFYLPIDKDTNNTEYYGGRNL